MFWSDIFMTNYLQHFLFSQNCLEGMMIFDKVLDKFLLLINFLHLSESCKKKDEEVLKDQKDFTLKNNTRATTVWIQSPNYPQLSHSVDSSLRFFPLYKLTIFNIFKIRLIQSFNIDSKNEYFHLQWLDLDLGQYSPRKVL